MAVLGLGTLAAGLARNGFEVYGVDSSPTVRDSLAQGRVHLGDQPRHIVDRNRVVGDVCDHDIHGEFG